MATPVKALTIFTIGTCLALNSCALAAGTDVLDEYLGKNAQLLGDLNVTKIKRAPDDVRPEDHHVALGETYVRINAALQISSTRRGFGGWSSILTNKQGTALLAVSDVGVWLEADLTFNTTTDIVSNLASVKMSPMRNITADGSEEGIAGNKEWGDAETLTSETGGSLGDDDGGAVLVSFERRHRIWKYTKDVDGPVPHPVHPGVSAIFSQCKLNGGVEAAEVLRDGRLFAVCEHPEPGSPHEDHVPGWIFTNWEGSKGDFGVLPIWLPLDGSFFGMTDLARLPPHGEHEEHDHLLLLSRAHVEVCDDCVMHGSAMRRAALASVHGVFGDEEDAAPRGASSEAIASLAETPFGAGADDASCAICLRDFETPDCLVVRLPKCSHAFHKGCISEWLCIRNACPLCKAKACVT